MTYKTKYNVKYKIRINQKDIRNVTQDFHVEYIFIKKLHF